MCRLSEHFTLAEFERTSTGGTLFVPRMYVPNICYGVHRILEPLRAHLGCPVIITSGWRSPEVNRRVGGVANSQHLLGEAADIKPQDPDKFDALVAFLSFHADTDQLLVGRGWAHISWTMQRPPRRMVRTNYYNY